MPDRRYRVWCDECDDEAAVDGQRRAEGWMLGHWTRTGHAATYREPVGEEGA